MVTGGVPIGENVCVGVNFERVVSYLLCLEGQVWENRVAMQETLALDWMQQQEQDFHPRLNVSEEMVSLVEQV
jgi:hypothetical protein